jgi:hypothetical protein
MEMSAHDMAQTLASLARRRAQTESSSLGGAEVTVLRGETILITLPHGPQFAVTVREVPR